MAHGTSEASQTGHVALDMMQNVDVSDEACYEFLAHAFDVGGVRPSPHGPHHMGGPHVSGFRALEGVRAQGHTQGQPIVHTHGPVAPQRSPEAAAAWATQGTSSATWSSPSAFAVSSSASAASSLVEKGGAAARCNLSLGGEGKVASASSSSATATVPNKASGDPLHGEVDVLELVHDTAVSALDNNSVEANIGVLHRLQAAVLTTARANAQKLATRCDDAVVRADTAEQQVDEYKKRLRCVETELQGLKQFFNLKYDIYHLSMQF